MSSLLNQDRVDRPEQFHWFGSIQKAVLDDWLESRHLQIPNDLYEFWLETGGGEFFQSPVILGPFGDAALFEDVDSVNDWYHERGLNEGYLVIQTDNKLTVIRLEDGLWIQLDEESFQEVQRFDGLEDWYVKIARPNM